MRIDKKISRYVQKKGYEIKNYKELCKILNEDCKTGVAKINQIKRWKLYFDFERDGNKIFITDIFDEDTIKENEKLFEENKRINNAYCRSRYRKELISVLLFLTANCPEKPFLIQKIELATACGFFNEEAFGKSTYDKYMNFRARYLDNSEKAYLKYDMNTSTFYKYFNEVKNNAYNSIERALKSLQELQLIDYEVINVGIKSEQKHLLTTFEEEAYIKCQKEACKQLLPFYNEHSKIQKDKIEEKDFIYRYTIREEYYRILNNLVSKKLRFDIIIKHYYISLIQDNFKKSIMFKKHLDYEAYLDSVQKINEDFIASLKSNMDKKIQEDEIYWINCQVLSLTSQTLINYNYSEGMRQKKAEQKYYNCSEIVDLLVSRNSETEIIDLEEFKKHHLEIAQKEFWECDNMLEFIYSPYKNTPEDMQLVENLIKNDSTKSG